MRMLCCLPLLAGCLAGETTSPGVLGSPADLMTPAGIYDGYRVVHPCPASSSVQVGVVGLGAVVPPTLPMVSEVGRELWMSLRDIPSISGGGGYGIGCDGGTSTSVLMTDWRDVDQVIARVGEYLEARDLGLQVGVLLTVAVPDSR
ncbi:MAG: hypothetical protein AB7P03_04570 [Kofleriaceae bacterium]